MIDEEREEFSRLRERLASELYKLHGPVITGEPLLQALGFKSKVAFRQALVRGRLSVPIFQIEHRRGKFAFGNSGTLKT